jgi:hypothetical protein
MDDVHDPAIIQVRGCGAIEMGPFSQTFLAHVVLLYAIQERTAADRAYGGNKSGEGTETGAAEGIGGLVQYLSLIEEGAANETPGWIEDIDEFPEQAHSHDCLWNSSNEESGLMPGHASLAMVQLSGSLRRAG